MFPEEPLILTFATFDFSNNIISIIYFHEAYKHHPFYAQIFQHFLRRKIWSDITRGQSPKSRSYTVTK